MRKLTCAEAKHIDLVDYLASLGYHPERIRNRDHWYLSPLRNEQTASFKVDRKLNRWYDHGTGQGGDLIDFGTQYFRCSISELLTRLSQDRASDSFSFQPQNLPGNAQLSVLAAGEKKDENKINIVSVRELTAPFLKDYLAQRCISLTVAGRHCKEVDFRLNEKQYTAIGFPNNAGGYELRNAYFKGSAAPKDSRFIANDSTELSVFEGFFSYLSYETMRLQQPYLLPNCQPNFLVLNSLSFLERSRSLMEQYGRVNLYLDRDAAGSKATAQAIEWDRHKYIDRSGLYQKHKDLNDLLVGSSQPRKRKRLGRRF